MPLCLKGGILMKIVAPITSENSHFAGINDMGQSHIEIHQGERVYMQPGEQPVIALDDNKLEDSTLELAYKSAIRQGVKSKDEFEKYNKKLRKDRRYNSYDDYILNLSKNYWGPLEAKLNKLNQSVVPISGTGKKIFSNKKKTISQNINVIKSTKVAIDSSLFYLSNEDIYRRILDNNGDLKKFREAEVEVLTSFLNSNIARYTMPGVFRKEIHLDEKGAIHAQVYSTYYRSKEVKRGQRSYFKTSWAKNRMVQEGLEKCYGNDLELQYFALKKAHEVANKEINEKRGGKRGGAKTVLVRFLEIYTHYNNNNLEFEKVSKADKANFCHDLARIHQRLSLDKLSREIFPKYGFEYSMAGFYTTAGIHKTAKEYEQTQAYKHQSIEIKNKLKQRRIELDSKRQQLVDKEQELNLKEQELEKNKRLFKQNFVELTQRVSNFLTRNKVNFEKKKVFSLKNLLSIFTKAVDFIEQKEQYFVQKNKELENRDSAVSEKESKFKMNVANVKHDSIHRSAAYEEEREFDFNIKGVTIDDDLFDKMKFSTPYRDVMAKIDDEDNDMNLSYHDIVNGEGYDRDNLDSLHEWQQTVNVLINKYPIDFWLQKEANYKRYKDERYEALAISSVRKFNRNYEDTKEYKQSIDEYESKLKVHNNIAELEKKQDEYVQNYDSYEDDFDL